MPNISCSLYVKKNGFSEAIYIYIFNKIIVMAANWAVNLKD